MDKTYSVVVGYVIELSEEVLELSGVDLVEINTEREAQDLPPLVVGESYVDTAMFTGVPHEFAVENPEGMLDHIATSIGVDREGVVLLQLEEEETE